MPDSALPIRHVQTSLLDIAYEEYGTPDGNVVVLLHGFPYDPRCFDMMVHPLAEQGYRIIVPYLRGYGQTRFLSTSTMRSGQQAALGKDVLELLDALSIEKAALMGADWGGRAACAVAALWPKRVRCLVSGLGYIIQDIVASVKPIDPQMECRWWYQYYFHTPRGREGLAANRYELGKLLWQLWSPSWQFDETTYANTAKSFENPDFVDVVIHSYRHRFAYAPGDPALEEIEIALAKQPKITVPSITLCGADDGVSIIPSEEKDASHFSGHHEYRILQGVGHNIPQEAPDATVAALLNLMSLTK